jgi:hypothetical protein
VTPLTRLVLDEERPNILFSGRDAHLQNDVDDGLLAIQSVGDGYFLLRFSQRGKKGDYFTIGIGADDAVSDKLVQVLLEVAALELCDLNLVVASDFLYGNTVAVAGRA